MRRCCHSIKICRGRDTQQGEGRRWVGVGVGSRSSRLQRGLAQCQWATSAPPGTTNAPSDSSRKDQSFPLQLQLLLSGVALAPSFVSPNLHRDCLVAPLWFLLLHSFARSSHLFSTCPLTLHHCCTLPCAGIAFLSRVMTICTMLRYCGVEQRPC